MLSSSLTEVAALLRSGRTSALDICNKCLKRIQAIEELNLFVTHTPEVAKQQAYESSERIRKGIVQSPLDGVPVAIKDNYSTDGLMTSCGSRMLHNYIPPYNATVAQRLFDGGIVMVGKTNMDEFGMGSATIDSYYGPAKNPWGFQFTRQLDNQASNIGISRSEYKGLSSNSNARHIHNGVDLGNQRVLEHKNGVDSSDDWFVTGGSSGGSAAAVAAGACFAAIGSDTGGSVRMPASFCGVVGLKPTYGLISRHGLISLVNSMDVPGIFTRSIDDSVLVLNALAGHDPKDSTSLSDDYVPFSLPDEISMKNLHIGIPKDFDHPALSTEVQEEWNNLADVLDNAGAKVTPVSLPHNKYSLAVYSVLNCCEVASNMARFDGIEFGHRAETEQSTEALYSASRHEGFNDVVRGRILCGNYFLLEGNYEKYFVKAQKVRRLITDDFDRVYSSGIGVLLTPTTLGTAPTYKQFTTEGNRAQQQAYDVFTMSANLAGIPAVSIPIKVTPSGLPVGLQLMGQSFKERQLLTVAKWVEREMNFSHLNLDYLD